MDANDVTAAAGSPLGLVVLVGLLMMLVAVLAGVSIWLLRDLRAGINQTLDKHGEELRRLWDHVARTEKEIPMRYVSRDDFILALTNIDRKLNQVLDKFDDLPCKNGGSCGSRGTTGA